MKNSIEESEDKAEGFQEGEYKGKGMEIRRDKI